MAVDQKIIDSLVKQILASSDTSKWTGEGFGSAEANAQDMAKILAGIGITDINQFGKITQKGINVEVQPDGNGGFIDQTGKPVDPKLVKADTAYTESGDYTTYTAPVGTKEVFGNKVTGQEVPNTYSERQTGNAFGGTFTGKGNTGYRVEFDQQGKPLFFTTSASSSDVPSWVKPALIAGGLFLGAPYISELLGAGAAGAAGAAEAAGAAGAAGASGLTAAELAQLDLALGGAGGTAGAETLASALTTGATVPTLTNLTGGSGLLTGAEAGITADTVAQKLAADTTTSGLLTPASTIADTTAATTAATPLTTPATTTTTGGLGSTVSNLLSQVPAPVTTALTTGLLSGLTGTQAANLISGGLSTVGGLLQQQTSKEAAQQAQARIDAETAAAKQAAQFRPVGMTTRFGTSNFTYDPVTGRMVSAGYQLSPEAKAQQDRLMGLANQGLTQAEQAQAQFAPLQTGAQSLFNLGNKYLAQTPEEVAQKYISQQMNLLQPGRELELANLQNRLQQQGRSGLAVAQGGTYGATTPELQALFNARAMQEAQLAANAQQAGQQQVQFGAGLLGQGAGAMGQYYAGQQAAYAPYTTAMGQAQNLEALGQQPFALSNALAQQQAQAGANAGRLGLTGAQLSAGLATSNAATTNPYATVLGGLGSPTSLLGQGLGQWATGLFGGQQGTGVAGNPLAVGEFANPGYWT